MGHLKVPGAVSITYFNARNEDNAQHHHVYLEFEANTICTI